MHYSEGVTIRCMLGSHAAAQIGLVCIAHKNWWWAMRCMDWIIDVCFEQWLIQILLSINFCSALIGHCNDESIQVIALLWNKLIQLHAAVSSLNHFYMNNEQKKKRKEKRTQPPNVYTNQMKILLCMLYVLFWVPIVSLHSAHDDNIGDGARSLRHWNWEIRFK